MVYVSFCLLERCCTDTASPSLLNVNAENEAVLMCSQGGSHDRYVSGLGAPTDGDLLEDHEWCCCGRAGSTWRVRG